MHTHSMKSLFANRRFQQASACAASTTNEATGLISELIYSENQPGMTQMLLLPLLQQLGTQSRWQLWLTPQQKLSRSWLAQSGLPLDKVMQVQGTAAINTLEAMIKALQTGNYSVVLGWLPEELSSDDRQRLHNAALCGQALGLIMRPDPTEMATSRPFNGLKIHSSLYH
ncbi:SOS-induced cell division inhibitor SulA [Erwinia phyllosphaerae]|uniref:SOS-induced cell division inhibitor SulA n=1 Tax=Erwinia phyllosphaerae TaxID=2853256 RepID=UPI001FED318E|nr:SOS-induced cell division inhibitor SulA [Erwinia phyllosphaerae]MBV4367830.1 cell division inhibitor SulA [Erwinia phyllosphaerae]